MASTSEPPKKSDPVVMYIVVRRDLMTDMQWPMGSVIAQGVHAALGSLWEPSDNDQATDAGSEPGELPRAPEKMSTEFIKKMHTVVLEAKNEANLTKLGENLDAAKIAYAFWREYPEDIITALATKPYRRSTVQPYFKKFRLFR